MPLEDALTNLQKIHDSLRQFESQLTDDKQMSVIDQCRHRRVSQDVIRCERFLLAKRLRWSGKSVKEIAVIMGRSPSTISSYIRCAMRPSKTAQSLMTDGERQKIKDELEAEEKRNAEFWKFLSENHI